MQDEVFKRRVEAVSDSLRNGRAMEACLRCRALRRELLADTDIPAEQLGFLRLLELESFLSAGFYLDAQELLERTEQVFILKGRANSRFLYLSLELFFHLKKPLMVMTFGRLLLRWHDNNIQSKVDIFRHLCDRLSDLRRSDLNFPFAQALFLIANITGNLALKIDALQRIAQGYQQKKLPSVYAFLARHLPVFLLASKENSLELEQVFESLQQDTVDICTNLNVHIELVYATFLENMASNSSSENVGHDCLLENVDPYSSCLKTGRGLLHVGVEYADVEFTQQAIFAGADLDLVDHFGRTPLHWAVMQGKDALRTLLLESGAQVNIQDINGFSPLDYAS